MQGFIVPGVSSRYEQTLQLLERAALRGWDGGEARFYRFGTTITELQERGYLEGARPGFYTDPSLFQKTFIEKVIESASLDHLTLVITDLFQNAADVSLLTGEIKKKYLANNLAVGVLGIKSEFRGTVYDVGIRNYSFTYASGSEPERFRPFYVLMFGKHRDIERYYETLMRSGLEHFPISKFIIFSRYLSDPLASLGDGKIGSTEKIVEVAGLLAPGLKDSRVRQFRLRGDSEASLVAVLKHHPLPYTMQLSSTSLDEEVTAWKCEVEKFADMAQAKPGFTIKGSTISASEVTVDLKINPSEIPGTGVYCFKVVLRPKEYVMPDWVTQWDMPQNRIEEWRRSPKQFDGSTTFNLKFFLNDLWETLVQLHKPKVAEFYCYVQKK